MNPEYVLQKNTEETTNKENLYHEDTPHNLVNITPDFAPIKEQTLLSSAIEDGMIYTNFDVTFDNDTTGNVLYINDPETLNFVAANVEDGDITTNYQFSYDNIESLTYEDLEGIAENNFPSESTYTVVDLATEATTTGEKKGTIKKLKKKKRYYVRVRAIKQFLGKNYYCAWSARQSVKTKK